MLILNVRLQLRFLYSRQWRLGDPQQLCTYVPVQASALPGLVTSDDGTCGNDTTVYALEQVVCNPRLDTVNDIHIAVLTQLAEQTTCSQTRDMLDCLVVYFRHGGAAPLQQGHLRATVRRYSGHEDREDRIIGLLVFDDVAPLPALRRYRSQFDQRIDIDVLFMPWWRMAGQLSALWHCHMEPSSRPLSIASVTPSSPESFSATSSSGSEFMYTEDP
jgi:hypothetical protein